MRLILFLNMGGVSKPDECALFLKNMFHDPYILTIKNDLLRSFVAWCITRARAKSMQKNYEQLGGKSPLNDITARLCARLNVECNALNLSTTQKQIASNALNSSTKNNAQKSLPQSLQAEVRFDFANNYVPPFADEVLARYQLTKDDEIVLFPLYAHHSQTTVLSALKCAKKALAKAKIPAKCSKVEVFYTNELYNEMIIAHILRENEKWRTKGKKTLIFSAHSLPVSTIKAGDVYQKHTEAHFALLKERLAGHFKDIMLSYQSKIGPVKWLTPATSQILANLDNVALIYPLSFCIDCSESVFELDIEYRKIAKNDYKVIACPNDSDEFVNFIKAYLNLPQTP